MNLVLDHLTKTYGKTVALQDFTASFTPGIYAILGPNGSGKSTLMNIITGNLSMDSGKITYAEEGQAPENIFRMGARFREKLGFMPQYPGMYPSFSAERFLGYIAALKGISKKETKEQIPRILSRVELADVRKKHIRTFSGGMKQRLALAQAVLGDPEILILDEPTAGLDPKQRIAIRNFISEIARNKIVLVATHIVSDVEFIAKNIIMLKKGVIEDNAPPQELVKKIEGKVWLIPCEEQEIGPIQERFRVTNIGREEESGRALLRILAEEKPADNARSIAPTLEDYYLYVFGNVDQNEKKD